QYKAGQSALSVDPTNPLRESDGGGGQRSILRLGAMASVRPSRAKAGDGRITTEALLHEPHVPLHVEVGEDGLLKLRVLTATNDASSVELLRPTAGGLSWGTYPMARIHTDDRFDYYQIS